MATVDEEMKALMAYQDQAAKLLEKFADAAAGETMGAKMLATMAYYSILRNFYMDEAPAAERESYGDNIDTFFTLGAGAMVVASNDATEH